MSRLVRDLQLVDARGRKYLATDECRRFLEAASIRIRTLKRRAERWCEVPVPPELLRALKLVPASAMPGSRPWTRTSMPRSRHSRLQDAP